MGSLIDDLLAFSRIGRAETQKTAVNLEELVRRPSRRSGQDTGRANRLENRRLPVCYGDRSMLKWSWSISSPTRSSSRERERGPKSRLAASTERK